MTNEIKIVVSPGELLDRICITEIRLSHLSDPEKASKVHGEVMALRGAWESSGIAQSHLQAEAMELWRGLWSVNRLGWDLEDTVRSLEANKDFGPIYVESCRAIHRNNDQRSATRRAINDLLGSDALEEKLHNK